MIEAQGKFAEGLFEARRQPGAKPESHRGEYKQRPLVEERNEADRINQINIEFLNMPVFAVGMPELKSAVKPEPKDLEARSSFLDIIEIILEMIADGVKAILPKGKSGTNIP